MYTYKNSDFKFFHKGVTMIIKNHIKKITAIGLALYFSTMTAVANQRFIDIPTNHWAHDYIISVSDQGFMVGNNIGEFRPNAPLDKFETSRILANIAGFRIVGASPEQQALQNRAEANQAALLERMGNTFTRWSNASNREIALLLEIGVLTEVDLHNFIVINDGEQLRALSRQEAAMFLARVFGFGQLAAIGVHSPLFADDAQISALSRHYVYFLRTHSVIEGDNSGSFFPNEFITRAALASMMYRTQNLAIEFSHGTPSPQPPTQPTPPSPISPAPQPIPPGPIDRWYVTNFSDYANLQGFVSNLDDRYITLHIRHITPGDMVISQDITFPLANNINFTIGNQPAILSDIQPGDIVTLSLSTSGVVFNIDAIERSRSFTGTLIRRGLTSVPGAGYIFSIRDEYDQYHNLLVTSNTVLERTGLGRVAWNQIRIGDVVEIVTEGQNIESLFAFGRISVVDGYVHSIFIRADLSEIVLRNGNVYTTYYITGTLEGLSNLNVGNRVRLRLDSQEIEGFTILS